MKPNTCNDFDNRCLMCIESNILKMLFNTELDYDCMDLKLDFHID